MNNVVDADKAHDAVQGDGDTTKDEANLLPDVARDPAVDVETTARPHRATCDGDVLARSLAFLSPSEISHCRRVSPAWRDAAESVPLEGRIVLAFGGRDDAEGRLDALARGFGGQVRRLRLDQTSSHSRSRSHSHSSMGAADVALACRAFPNLRRLAVRHCARLAVDLSSILRANGGGSGGLRHLTHLNLHGNEAMEWNLSDLRELACLVDVRCVNNVRLRGALRDAIDDHPNASRLVALDVSGCRRVTGDLRDLAGLPSLAWMGLSRTAVRGDLRAVREEDFPSLRMAGLDGSMYGASEVSSVADAAVVMRVRGWWIARSDEECPVWPFRMELGTDSPEYYERVEQRLYTSERDPPFGIENLCAGGRRGWRWSNHLGGVCGARWLDPPPAVGSEGYATYLEELRGLRREEEESMFGRFLDPPTPAEYERLCLLERT